MVARKTQPQLNFHPRSGEHRGEKTFFIFFRYQRKAFNERKANSCASRELDHKNRHEVSLFRNFHTRTSRKLLKKFYIFLAVASHAIPHLRCVNDSEEKGEEKFVFSSS